MRKAAVRPASRKQGQRGRPVVEDPKVTLSLRFSRSLLDEVDAWARENGEMGRSAAIRHAVTKLVRGGN